VQVIEVIQARADTGADGSVEDFGLTWVDEKKDDEAKDRPTPPAASDTGEG
jgi:hypothetical protein